MRKTPGIIVAFALLAAGAAAAQQPSAPARAPAQNATPQQQPAERPALNLRLDSAERRPAVTFTPRDADKKPEAAQSLPGLGGKPSKTLNESDPTTVIPVTNDNIE